MARRINLVPRGERARTTTNVGVLALVAAGIIVVFALGLGYYLFNNTLSDRKQELEDVKAERASLEAQVNALREYEQLASKRQAAEKLVQQIYAGRTLVDDILNDISQVVPPTVWFTDLSLTTADPEESLAATQGGTLVASGNTLSLEGKTYTFEDVAQLLVRLRLVPSLAEVDLMSAGTEPDVEIKTFSIEALVINTQPEDAPLPLSTLTQVEWQ
jgi:Tfp pilus assembly protein PilN